MQSQKAIVVGPWGGAGGNRWDDGSYDGVREITLVYGRCIYKIQVIYSKNCKPVSAATHGSHQEPGAKTTQIKLGFPEEFLTTVTGHYGELQGLATPTPVIRSLKFTSNKRTFGPFGVEEGTAFSFPMRGGKIVGFEGRTGWYLDAIGFHISPTENSPKTTVVVPSGGNGGNSWDDGIYDGVREITLVYGRCINKIQVIYSKNCKPVSAETHGNHQEIGAKTTQIKLEFPEEFLTTVTGHYGVLQGLATPDPVIRSLRFKSNKRTFGPFGVEEGTAFSFPVEGGKIVGFKGRSGWYLDAIGFYLLPA